jgi:hypothetical protein
MRLFGRKWSVQIFRTDFSGLDMSFNVHKTTKPEPNECELRLYNMSPVHRAGLDAIPLVKLPQAKGAPKFQHEGIPVRITAGYEEADTLIWSGDLRTVESTHEGENWVTILTAGDGAEAYRKSRINQSFGPGTPIAMVITTLAKALGVGPGNVAFAAARISANASVATLASMGIVLSGSVAENLTALCNSGGLEWSIQSGVLQFTERGMPTLGKAVFLSSATGMIGSPSLDQEGTLNVQMFMIPGVQPGSLLVVASERIQGNFRVEAATYKGDTSGNPWTITAECSRI